MNESTEKKHMPSQANPLLNSRPLDVHRWSDYPVVTKATEELCEELGFKDKRYKTCLRMLMVDLYHAWRIDPKQYIAYSRDSTAFAGGRRYNKLYIKYKVLINAVDALVGAGYIEHHIGGHFVNPITKQEYGFQSRMRANKMLIRFIVKNKIKPKTINRCEDEETIVLRGVPIEVKKGNKTFEIKLNIDYDDEPPYITRARKHIKTYNNLLNNTYIDVDDEHLADDEAANLREYSLDLSRKNVHRVFNNGKWNEGGRYYGAWWMDCPKLLRKYIKIDGNYTVELDYSSVHIHLLYALKKINYAETGDDAYTLDGFPNRDLNKFIMLIAINAMNERDCIGGIWSKIAGKNKLREYGISNHQQIKDILHALKSKHSPIEEYIASGYGVKLQCIDSIIAEQIINYFAQRNIPVLTVHDSFICTLLDEPVLLDQMRLAYTRTINRFMDIKYDSNIEVIFYDKEFPEDLNSNNDAILNVDKKHITIEQIKYLKSCNMKHYSQGRRQLRWQLTANVNQFARLSNIDYNKC